MYFESRYSVAKLKRFAGRNPRKVAAVLLVLFVLLGAVLWNEMTGARAATIDMINSTFENGDGANWTAYGVNNSTVNVSSSVYNHTTVGSISAMTQTETVGPSVYYSGGIKRSFETPNGLKNVSLSVYYKNIEGSSLNLRWEITNGNEEYLVVLASGIIPASASENDWTHYEALIGDPSAVGILPGFTYELRLYADGTTLDQEGASMSVNWDDVVLSATYDAEPTTVSISSSRLTIPNNNITHTNVTATVYDQNGRVMSGEPVNFSTNPATGNFFDSETGPNGETIVKFKSDTGGPVRITAAAANKPGVTDYTDITVLYPASISVSSSLDKIPNDNIAKAKITARVRDQNGQLLEGVKVEFSDTPNSGNFTWNSGNTDARGEAHTYFKSNVGGNYIITAKSKVNPSTEVTKQTAVIVQQPNTLTMSVDTGSIPNDNLTTVTVSARLVDLSGKDMNGEKITFTRTPESGSLSSASATTGSDGTAQITFKSNVGASYTITGTVYRAPGVNNFCIVKVIAPTTLTLAPSVTTIPSDNKTVSTITATLVDQVNQPIKGEKINLTTNLGVFTSTGTNTVEELVTDSLGQVKVNFKSAAGGAAKIVGEVVRTGLQNSGLCQIEVQQPVPKTILITSSRTSVPDDNSTTATVTATVYNQLGQLMNGQAVEFEKSTSAGSLTPAGSIVTDSNGMASVQFKTNQVGTVTITAKASAFGTTASNSTNISVIARVPNNLTMSASSASIPDDGSTTAVITAHLLDQFGRPFSNRTVYFHKDKAWGTLYPASAVTDENGDAVVTFKSPISGEVKITASSGGASAQQVITVQKRTGAKLTLTAAPPVNTSDGGQESVITAQLKDQFDLPLSGKKINFSTGLGKLSAVTATTDASGNATVKVKSNATGTSVVTGTVDDVLPVMGVVIIEFRGSDSEVPVFLKAEPTSKQVFYLTFNENIKFNPDPPVGWTLKKHVGASVYDVPFKTPVIMNSDRRVVKVVLEGVDMDTGNQYPNSVWYEITVDGIFDLAGNPISPLGTKVSFDAFTPHGKYSSASGAAGNSTRICAQCHSNHKAVGQKLLTSTTVKKVCFVCHGNTGISSYKVEAEFYRGSSGYSPSMHKALDSDSPGYDDMTCVDCHNPHGNRRSGSSSDILPKLLRAKTVGGTVYTSADGNYFCLACHGSDNVNSLYGNRFGLYWKETLGDHSGGMNVVGIVYNSVHYDNRFEALKPSSQTNITCSRCHESHGSMTPQLVDNSMAGFTQERLCYKCHTEADPVRQKFEATGGNTSKHNITDPENIGLSCRSCHEPHTISTRSFDNSGEGLPSNISDPENTKENWYKKPNRTISQFCIKCHDADSGVTVTQTRTATENLGELVVVHVPFTVKLPKLNFANGTGWDKSSYTSSGHSSSGIDCNRCHDPHGSSNKRLNTYPEDTGLDQSKTMCLRCHGTGGVLDIYSDQLTKEFTHKTLERENEHDDTEKYSAIAADDRHAECVDCHDPHTTKNTGSSQTKKLGNVAGVKFSQEPWSSWTSSSGKLSIMNPDSSSRQAYLCYKCHSKFSNNVPLTQTDVAKEFNPANPARHVVEGNSQMPAFTVDSDPQPQTIYYGDFKNSWEATSSMKCTDCHGPSTGSTTGPHGSENRYILKKPWSNQTGTETGSPDDLCFDCHDYSFYTGIGSVADPDPDPGSFTKRSQFSGGTGEYRYNLHGGKHAKAGCVSCHGTVPHGWNKTDSNGGGLALFTTDDDDLPYDDGVLIKSIGPANTPGDWTSGITSCTTSCH